MPTSRAWRRCWRATTTLPKQLAFRGERLAFSNGIVMLGGLSALLIVVFGGSTGALLPLYAVAVFAAFTLSQSGMVEHWRQRARAALEAQGVDQRRRRRGDRPGGADRGHDQLHGPAICRSSRAAYRLGLVAGAGDRARLHLAVPVDQGALRRGRCGHRAAARRERDRRAAAEERGRRPDRAAESTGSPGAALRPGAVERRDRGPRGDRSSTRRRRSRMPGRRGVAACR